MHDFAASDGVAATNNTAIIAKRMAAPSYISKDVAPA
jgi:hypothetical protein